MEFLGKLHCLVNYYSSVNQIVLWVNKLIFDCNHYFSLETFTVGDKFKVVLPIEKLLCLVKLIKTSFPRKITLIKLLLCHNWIVGDKKFSFDHQYLCFAKDFVANLNFLTVKFLNFIKLLKCFRQTLNQRSGVWPILRGFRLFWIQISSHLFKWEAILVVKHILDRQ